MHSTHYKGPVDIRCWIDDNMRSNPAGLFTISSGHKSHHFILLHGVFTWTMMASRVGASRWWGSMYLWRKG